MTALYKQLSDKDFTTLILSCNSMREVMQKLGYKSDSGTARNKIKERCNALNLPIPHLAPNDMTKMANLKTRLSDEEYFVKGKERKGADLRKRLLTQRPNCCEVCGLDATNWNGQPLNLQVDHIDGDHYNNLIENLRLVCPNCHSQTDTYCGKNIKH